MGVSSNPIDDLNKWKMYQHSTSNESEDEVRFTFLTIFSHCVETHGYGYLFTI